MAEADPMAAVRSILLADSGVTGQVSTRVYGDELPGSQNQQMPRKCVVLSYSGGGSLGPGARSYVPWGVTRMDVRSYGATPYEASQVRNAVHMVLKFLRRTVAASTVVHGVTVSGGPLTLRDPDTGWPHKLMVYDVNAIEFATT